LIVFRHLYPRNCNYSTELAVYTKENPKHPDPFLIINWHLT
jgi:hypothetical protein